MYHKTDFVRIRDYNVEESVSKNKI